MIDEKDVLNSINANPNQVGSNYKPSQGEDLEIDDNQQNSSRSKDTLIFVWETAKVIIISLAIILPIRYYLVQPFFVKGASMESNFHDGDYLLIDEISYRLGEPTRGDVVVFRYPENQSQFFIKRIIGLPGETVEVSNNEVIIYNSEFPQGAKLDEYYLSAEQRTLGEITMQLSEGEYFVLGDNRLQSSDSRRWGSVNKSLITGRAFLRLWPVNNITKVEAVNY